MAYAGYGAKYTLTFSDVYQDEPGQYIATILKKDYVGAVVEISGTDSPLVIETDRSGDFSYRPIIASKASLNILIGDVTIEANWQDNTNIWELYNLIWEGTGFDFTEFITAESDTFMLEVKAKRPGNFYEVIWQGHYISNTDVSLVEILPINFTLQFSDFNQSKINRFFNFPPEFIVPVHYFPSDKISLLDIFIRCAYFTKNTTNVKIEFPYNFNNTYIDGVGDTITTNSLINSYVQKNAFLSDLGKYKTIYDVLDGVCSQFGLIAYFENNTLCIKSYKNLINETTRYSKLYEITGFNDTTDSVIYNFVDDVTENDTLFPLNSGVFKNVGRDQVVKFNYPVKEVEISNTASKNFNTPNYTMSSVSQVKGSGGDVYYAINNWYKAKDLGPLLVPLNLTKEAVFNYSNIYDPGKFVALPFHPYATDKTQTYGTSIATRVVSRVGFDANEYVDSEPFSVDSGDAFAFSYSAFTDGRVKNYATSLYPNIGVAIIVQADDADGNTVTYFYNAASNKFITNITNYPLQAFLPLIKLVNYENDSDKVYIDIKGSLDIPNSAKIRIRHYNPYRTSAVSPQSDIYDIYLQYCNLQVFKSSNVSSLPTKQTYKTFYAEGTLSESAVTLNSDIFIQDSSRYVPEAMLGPNDLKNKNPMFVPSCYGNTLFDSYYNPAAGIDLSFANLACIDLSYSTLKATLQDINENILKNCAVVNSTIEGTYVAQSNFGIGNKFTYQIIGYEPKNFVLLDYSIDLKNAQYNSLLYSSEFTDTTEKAIESKTIIE